MLGLAADVLAAGQTPVCEEDLFELLDGGAFEAEMGVADHPARGVVRQQVVSRSMVCRAPAMSCRSSSHFLSPDVMTSRPAG